MNPDSEDEGNTSMDYQDDEEEANQDNAGGDQEMED